MVLIRKIIISLLFIVSLVGTTEAKDFPYPEIPADLRTPVERASYLITHFWDNADFSDMETIEQGFADFISVFPPADSTARAQAMRELVRASGASSEVAALVEDYLYTPASPVYDEEYFILFLNAQLESDLLSDEAKVRPALLLDEAMLNRVGAKAADFHYIMSDGTESTLYESLPEGEKPMLLFFYDPTCDVCHKFMELLTAEEADIPVLAIYPDDDADTWREHIEDMPSTWRVGMADVFGLYSIREFPTVYVLSSDGRVIRKNISESDLPLSGM